MTEPVAWFVFSSRVRRRLFLAIVKAFTINLVTRNNIIVKTNVTVTNVISCDYATNDSKGNSDRVCEFYF